MKPVDRVLLTLASECLQHDTQAMQFTEPIIYPDVNSMMSLAQHWAVVHVRCVPRLVMICTELVEAPKLCGEPFEDSNICSRLSFSLRIFRLLRNVMKDMPYISYDAGLLQAVACFADALPNLFRLGFEFVNIDSFTVDIGIESLSLSLLEEFLKFVQVVFCDGSIFQNIQTCMLASIFDILDVRVCIHDNSVASLKPPLVYSPRVVIFLLKLVGNIKSQSLQIFNWKETFDRESSDYGSDTEISTSCHIRSVKVPLLKKYTVEDRLKLIFLQSNQWVDNLMQLALFLHSEGVKLRPKVDRLCTSAKSSGVSDIDSAVTNEDEALFGDLFSEAGRSVGVADGHGQAATVNCMSSYCNMPMQAATELLSFLKAFFFAPEWHSVIYEDACTKLNAGHVDLILSILLCQACSSDERATEIGAGHRKLGHINEVCFELLQNLIVKRALCDSLEEHLVDQILKVENGIFTYNDHTLTLLAHALLCKVGLAGKHLRTKIYERYTNFILEKAKHIFPKCASLKEFLATLPCIFHIEILLMAFHLSTEAEKAALANLLFSSLRAMDSPSAEFSSIQLSCWSLLVSRLILVLHHMISYTSTCPSWLLFSLRSKLREGQSKSSSPPASDHFPSWASIAVENIMGGWIKEEPVITSLLHQLIDVSMLPTLVSGDGQALQCLGLNWDNLCATFSWILGFWKHKKPETVEDLILERYIFILCWVTSGIGSASCRAQPSAYSLQVLDVLDVESFFRFSHALLGQSGAICDDLNILEVTISVLKQLDSVGVIYNKEHGWDFLRNGSWLSLVLSILHAGVWVFSVKSSIPGVEPLTENTSKDREFLALAENLGMNIVQGSHIQWLFKVLSSLLRGYLQALQKAFVSTMDCSRHSTDRFSPLLLLKNTGFEKCTQDELLEKSGSRLILESVYRLLTKLEEFISKDDSGNAYQVIQKCFLHGFPSHLETPSAVLVSCILTVKGIICTIDGLLKLKIAGGDFHLDTEVLNQLLDSVMAVKSDKIFQCIHGNCEDIYKNLSTSNKERLDYSYLFVMKHMESILTDVCSREVIDNDTHEMVVISAVDFLEGLRKDPSKADIFKFYLGAEEEMFEHDKELYGGQRGNLLVFINALDKCFSEPVNLRVLNFFVDILNGEICPGLKNEVQSKFLKMDLSCLSNWLEKRLLGCTAEAPGGLAPAKGSSASLREATMSFVLCLISPPSFQSRTFQSHFIESLLVSLDSAFMLYDIHTAQAYFNFIVQLSNGEPSMRQLLRRTVVLMEKLSCHENLLQGLKFLFGFVGAVLSACGANKNVLDMLSGKHLSTNGSAAGPMVSRTVGSRKTSETLVLPTNPESGSASIDCDATSVDEDEDDGTSDGELASMDKDDEDDINSERVLASKVCTFTSSGSNFMEQHWYFCYTCDLTVSKGCCSVCAKVCHRGHRVVYSRSSRFFCDCGAGGVRGSSCQCLKPRKFSGSNNTPGRGAGNFQPFLPFSEDGEQPPDSDSDLEDDAFLDFENSFKLSIPQEVQEGLPSLLKDLDIEGQVLELCNKLLPAVTTGRESNLSKDKKVLLAEDKVLTSNVDLLQLKKAYKSGSLDLKIKADYSNAKELKSHLASGSLIKSLLSISIRGKLAAGEGDKVTIFDVGQLIGQPTVAPVTADKTNAKHISKNVVRFEIVHLMFNPVVECYLAVAGYEECQVLTVNPRGEVTDRLAIELALQGAYIRRVDWVPGSQVQLMVVTNKFVKIYDLSQDNISPMHYFTLPDDLIVDATLIVAPQGRMFLLVLSELGCLYRLELSMEGDVGAKPLNELIRVQGKDMQAKGLSLYFSSTYRLLFLSFQDGTSLIGRLDANATSLTEICSVFEDEQDGKLRPAGLHHWKELLAGSGFFACFSSLKANAVLIVSMGANEFFMQNVRSTVGSALPVVGITSYRPLSKDKTHCLVLHDDGSLQIFSHIPVGVDSGANATSDQAKKLGSGILSNRAYAGSNPEFPLDFFEKTVCITADVKLSGDAIRNSDSEGTKQNLASDDGFLESPNSAGFKVS